MAVLLLTTVGCSAASADEASLQRQILALQNQLALQQQDLATLRGEMEQLRYLVQRQCGAPVPAPVPAVTAAPLYNTQGMQETVLTTAQSGQQTNPNYGVAGQPSGPVTPMGNDNLKANNGGAYIANTPAPNAAPAAAAAQPQDNLKPVDPTAKATYDAAYAYVRANDLKSAEGAFQAYVDRYPDNKLTPNAWYWLGQVQYSQALYDKARLSFLNVARFEQSRKRPDALFKLGMINKFVGDMPKAQRYFQLVIQTYPQDTAAALASRELQRIQ